MAKKDRRVIQEKRQNLAREARDGSYEPLYKREKRSKLVIDHKRTAHVMVKFLHTIPHLHPLTKKVMTLRLLGAAPDYRPLTVEGVALMLGLRNNEVKALEKEGGAIASSWMERHSAKEGVEKFNREKDADKDVRKIQVNP